MPLPSGPRALLLPLYSLPVDPLALLDSPVDTPPPNPRRLWGERRFCEGPLRGLTALTCTVTWGATDDAFAVISAEEGPLRSHAQRS